MHAFPTSEEGGVDGECGGSITGGHFNPTFKTAPFTPGDQSTYEVGDLGGKHGNLGIGVGATTDTRTYQDTTASIIWRRQSRWKNSCM